MVDGVKASAVVFSLMLTCRLCSVESYAYLLHVLQDVQRCALQTDGMDLLPLSYAKQ